MCGLVGFWSAEGDRREFAQLASRMADRIKHRGPDDHGTWHDEDAGLVLAHRRLSILDLSAAGHQPMQSACGRYVIAFNGEIYNHQELRDRLEAEGNAPNWRGHADTEILLAAFVAWDIKPTLEAAVGMFAFALWDRRERVLTLARDRMGEKPLYYGWHGDSFLFGSELAALKAHPAFNASINRSALALFLRHSYVPTPYSIYESTHKLPMGTLLQLQPGQRDAAPVAYWSLTEVAERGVANSFVGSDDDALEALESHLRVAVRGQMVADVPLGALLSGGIDSTTIVALMQANSSQAVRTFTIGFEERDQDEAVHARAVAAHLRTDHTELRLSSSDALALLPEMPGMYSEPFADPSQLPTHLVMKLARQHVTVALSGDAGDELFGGYYNRYFLIPKFWRRVGWMPLPLRRALGAVLTALPSDLIDRLAGPLAKWAGIARPGGKAYRLGLRLRDMHSIDDLAVSLTFTWPEASRMVVKGRIPPNLLDDRANWPKLAESVARMMALDGQTYLPDDILVKVDRAAMAVSLETRVPFLDRDLVEFAWSLPQHMKIRNGQGKWLLRRLLDRYVPRALMDRPKMGFDFPLDVWLRGPLREWAEPLLAEDRLRTEGYLDPVPIRAAWRAHVAEQASHGYRLWSVLMFQAWLEANS